VYHEITKGTPPPLDTIFLPRHHTAGGRLNWRRLEPDHVFNPFTGKFEPVDRPKTPGEAALLLLDINALIAQPFFERFDTDQHTNINLWRQDSSWRFWRGRFWQLPDTRWLYRPDNHSDPKDRLPFLPYNPNDPAYMEKMKVHAKLLAEMIPPLSSAAGGVPLMKLDPNRTFDLNNPPYKKNTLWPEVRLAKVGPQQTSKRWFHFDYKEAPYLLTHQLYEKITEITQGETP
jgi:hypothetical protein